MITKGRTVAAILFIVLGTSSLIAQNERHFGVMVGTPTTAGAIWNFSKHVAVRPDFSYSQNGSNGGISGPSDSKTLDVGVSGLVYLKDWDALRLYVAPRFGYGRTSVTTYYQTSPEFGGSIIEVATRTLVQPAYSGSAAVGGQYAVSPRFSVFGEAGYGYRRLTSTSQFLGGVITRTHTWATRSTVGVIIYF